MSVRRKVAAGAVGIGLLFASAPALAQVNSWRGLVTVESAGKNFRVTDPACDQKPVRGQFRLTKTNGPAQGTLDNRSGCGTAVGRNAPSAIHGHRACVITPGVSVACSNWWFF